MDTNDAEIGAMIGKLMSDPQVASLVKRLKEENAQHPPAGASGEDGADGTGENYQAEVTSDIPAKSGSGDGLTDAVGKILASAGKGSAAAENRNRLLSALKPFVSRERREMIDKVASISKLTGILDAAHRGADR